MKDEEMVSITVRLPSEFYLQRDEKALKTLW